MKRCLARIRMLLAAICGLFSRLALPAEHRPRLRRAVPLIVVVASVFLLFVGLFYVRTRMQIVQIGYDISELESKNKELGNRKRELLLEVASLQSPEEIEKKARKQGLVIPSLDRVVHVP